MFAARRSAITALGRRRKMYAAGMPARVEKDGRPVVDFRSDTVTQPSEAQRRAMMQAAVGDDVLGEDPAINDLERRSAAMLGKEAGLFLPSGTMGNLAALMSHCWERGCEIIVGRSQHIAKHEQGNFAQFGSISCTTLENEPDGTIDLSMVRSAYRSGADYHAPRSRLLCLENTHNVCGGVPLSLEYMEAARRLCDELGMAMHVDGARFLNAAIALGVRPAALARPAHSVQMCFSKGIGAPVGSILVGEAELIARARRVRKALGGGMRQAGILAAAASCALDSADGRLGRDHQNAARLAAYVNGLGSDSVRADAPRTNIVLLRISKPNVTAERVTQLLKSASAECAVLCYAMDGRTIRLVTHSDASSHSDMQLAEAAIKCTVDIVDAE